MRVREWYVLAAGACDTATGLLLTVAPDWTLGLMRVPPPGADPIWLRFIGAFVAGVGLIYLLPGRLATADRRAALSMILLSTAIVRATVGSFVTVALLSGALPPAWSSVAVTDLGLALLQAGLLVEGRTRHAV